MHKPFHKYPGAKTKLVKNIGSLLDGGEVLFEPFVGSGSVMNNLDYDRYVLNDVNRHLIELYGYLKTDASFLIDEVEQLFSGYVGSEKQYYIHRKEFNLMPSSVFKSALFVYLNRTCFNGLVRFNSQEKFNVPFGKYKNVYAPLAEMERMSSRLKRAVVLNMDFRCAFEYVGKMGAMDCYCDPPYLELKKGSFAGYSGRFIYDDHKDLVDCCDKIVGKGGRCVISNHDSGQVRELYSGAIELKSIDVSRSISANGQSRGTVGEVFAVYR